MKKFLILMTITALVIGCNRSSTISSGAATRTGETHSSRYTPESGGGKVVAETKTVVKRLTLTAANEQTISRGSTDKILITIDRDNFSDPVTISFDNLPQGVSIADTKSMVITADSKTLTVTLKADATAPVGEHMVTINAVAQGVEKNSHQFKLTIK